MRELGLPGCLAANGSCLGPLPVQAFVLANVVKGAKKTR